MNNCPYCNNKDVQARIIYKDDVVMAFPGNMPIVPGHILVCPVRHISKIDDLSDDELKAIKNLVVKTKESLKKTLGAQGFNIAFNEEKIAGQSVNHLHIHIVPRKIGDTSICEYEPRKFLYRPGERETTPEVELQKISKLIKEKL